MASFFFIPCEYSRVSFLCSSASPRRESNSSLLVRIVSLVHQVDPADEREVLACREVIEQRQVFGNDADPSLRLQRLAGVEHIPAQHEHLTAGRGEQPREHLDRRRLARPVGPQESVEGAGLDGQVDAVHGGSVAEVASQPLRLDRQGHGYGSPGD